MIVRYRSAKGRVSRAKFYLCITENALSETLKLRPMELDSGSSYNLDVAAKLFHTCTNEHKECDDSSCPLPSRILYLDGTEDTIKLIDNTEDLVGGYTCLSYCVRKLPGNT